MHRTWPRIIVAALALAAIATGLFQLRGLSTGLQVATERYGTIPVTVFRASPPRAAPLVVIAHGFAGSQQLMQPFAMTLARNGYIAVTFDFPGHGRNPEALSGGLADLGAMQRDLLGTLDAVCRYARTLQDADQRVAVLGHSMSADVVVRYADSHPDILGTVAVSLFLPNPAEFHPHNLLIVDGALEAGMLREQAFAIVDAEIGKRPEPDTTYGDFSDGSARRIAFARGVEHIGVLYSADSMAEAAMWLDQVFGHSGTGYVDRRGMALGLLFLGIIALAWPLAGLLPRLAAPPQRAALGWKLLLPLAALPALFTPLILWKLPTDFLPLLLGDYLVVHFALFGLLTGAMLWLLRRRLPAFAAPLRTPWLRFAIAAILITAYSLLAIGLPLDAYVLSFLPGPWRLPLIAALAAGTLPYFIADEWLTRRLAPLRGAYAATKLFFLLSLVIAVALNLQKLFFLVIIVPVILMLFLVYGLISAWVNRSSGHPLLAAVANAIVFAWCIAVTFPVVRH